MTTRIATRRKAKNQTMSGSNGSRKSRPVTGPLVGKRGKTPAPSNPARENPYDVLFN